MDNKSTTKRMIGAVVLVLVAALLLAWLLKGKNRSIEQRDLISDQAQDATPILGFPGINQEASELLAQNNIQADDEYVIGEPVETPTDTMAMIQQSPLPPPPSPQVTPAPSASEFSIRDTARPTEVRQVIDGGVPEPGIGSIGANVTDTSIPAIPQPINRPTETASTQQPAQQTPQTQRPSEPAPAPAAAPTAPPAASGSRPSLVNERPVPPPATQTQQQRADEQARAEQERQAQARAEQERQAQARAEQERAAAASRPPTPATATESAPVSSAAASRSGYVVQVLATSSRAGAEEVRQSLAVDGYPVFVTEATVDGKKVYRVRVGTYPSRTDAAAVQSRMKARYTRNQYVQNSFVTGN